MVRAAILHHYRAARRHQMDTYRNSGLHIDGVDQRQFTGGSAPYQYHAVNAYWSARRMAYAHEQLRERPLAELAPTRARAHRRHLVPPCTLRRQRRLLGRGSAAHRRR